MKLDIISTDDLVKRWEVLFEQYKVQVKDLESFLTKFNKTREELLIIRQELISRGVPVENDTTTEPGRPSQSSSNAESTD